MATVLRQVVILMSVYSA